MVPPTPRAVAADEPIVEGSRDPLILPPGVHIVEAAARRRLKVPTAIADAFALKGIEATADARPAKDAASDPIARVVDGRTFERLAVRSESSLRLASDGPIRWLHRGAVGIDLRVRREDFGAFALEHEKRYELIARARLMLAPRRATFEALETMGFAVAMLFAIERCRSAEGVSATVWYARATWSKVSSITSPHDPFFFEAISEVTP